MKYSVVVLTKNEELAIRDCLLSVESDDIWVVDSESTDRTIEVISSVDNVRIVNKPFENYAKQRNFALNLNFRYNWVLMLDADERLTHSSRSFLNALNERDLSTDTSMISFLRRDYFLDKWLRGASGYPLHFPRVFHKGSVRVERDVNEVFCSDGKNLKVQNYIDHYPFIKGINHWYERHLLYSSMEVEALAARPVSGSFRSKIKHVFYKLPFRYVIMFVYLYIFKKGFLAGYPGFLFCLMRATYEIMIVIKQKVKQSSNGT